LAGETRSRVKPDLQRYLGSQVTVEVDRPLGSVHPKHSDIVYTINYGFIPGTTSGDGMPIDVYVLGIDEAVIRAEGVVVAVIEREDDNEDKLVVSTKTGDLDADVIRKATAFQEQFFKTRIILAGTQTSSSGDNMDKRDANGSLKAADSPVVIRRAIAGDAGLIIKLIVGLAEFEKLPPPDEAAQRRLIADAFGPRPRFEIYLAEVDSSAAGYAFVFETYSTFLAMPTLYLEDLFILPEYRGKRIGYALMLHLAREALRRGCGRLEWVVLDWNSHAIDFYERLGARRLADWLPYRLDIEGLQRLVDES
jgi:inorganic pyrophosphatase/GNAT superfamily N-acetyltransferase